MIDVEKAEGRPLNVPLTAPFTIASSRLDSVGNVAIRVELSNGCAGWGETPILPSVTAEDQITALEKVGEACVALRRARGRTLGSVLGELGEILPGHEFASVSWVLVIVCISLSPAFVWKIERLGFFLFFWVTIFGAELLLIELDFICTCC